MRLLISIISILASLFLLHSAQAEPFDVTREDKQAAWAIAEPLLPAFKRSDCHIAIEYELKREDETFFLTLYQSFVWFTTVAHPDMVIFAATDSRIDTTYRRRDYVLSNRCDNKQEFMQEYLTVLFKHDLPWRNPRIVIDEQAVASEYDKDYAAQIYLPE